MQPHHVINEVSTPSEFSNIKEYLEKASKLRWVRGESMLYHHAHPTVELSKYIEDIAVTYLQETRVRLYIWISYPRFILEFSLWWSLWVKGSRFPHHH